MRQVHTRWIGALALLLLATVCLGSESDWKPSTDWAHWRLGHRSDPAFLRDNGFTVTFGSGAPNFDQVASRQAFDSLLAEASAFNDSYHERGYIVLRYLSTSLEGHSADRDTDPVKSDIDMLDFWKEQWATYSDYLGPPPEEDPREWITVRPDGSFPFYRYARYGEETSSHFETWGCPDNPDYVRYMKGRIRAQAQTGIDGSYIDWTQIAGGTCYCSYSDSAFRAYLQENLPSEVAQQKYGRDDYEAINLPQQREDSFWMEWLQFRGHAVADFHRTLRAAARQINPHFLVSGNVYGGFGYGPIAYDAAGNVELLGREGYDDFLYSEIQEYLELAPQRTAQGQKVSNSPALKFLAAVTRGKPVIEYAIEITPPIFPNPSEQVLSTMAQLNIAEATANHAIFREKRQTPPGATAIHRLLADHAELRSGAQLRGAVAVLASLRPYLADEISFAFTFSRVLADRGLHHIMITEADLAEGKLPEGTETIVVPRQPLLPRKVQQALVDFAREGGTLFVLGASGVKDQYGLPAPDGPLHSLLGGAGTERSERELGQGRVVFEPLPLPESRYLVAAEQDGEATTFGPAMLDRFPDLPEAYTRGNIDPELRRRLDAAVERLLGRDADRITRRTTPNPFLEITRMLDPEREQLLLHMVNYNATVLGEVAPAKASSCRVRLPEGYRASRLVLARPGHEDVEHGFRQQQGGTVNMVEVDPLDVELYALLIFHLEPQ